MDIKDENENVIAEVFSPLTKQALQYYMEDAYSPQEIAEKHGLTVDEVIQHITEWTREKVK